jgi:hypothetical protein
MNEVLINLNETDISEIAQKIIVQDAISTIRNDIFLSAIIGLILIIVYFVIEYIKIYYSKQDKSLDSIIICNDWFNYFQNIIIIFMFIIFARLLQYSIWAMN